jgi:hypothetical protein
MGELLSTVLDVLRARRLEALAGGDRLADWEATLRATLTSEAVDRDVGSLKVFEVEVDRLLTGCTEAQRIDRLETLLAAFLVKTILTPGYTLADLTHHLVGQRERPAAWRDETTTPHSREFRA